MLTPNRVITFFILPFGVMQVTQSGKGKLLAIDLIEDVNETTRQTEGSE